MEQAEFHCHSPDCGVKEGRCVWEGVCPAVDANSGVEVREITLFLPGEAQEQKDPEK